RERTFSQICGAVHTPRRLARLPLVGKTIAHSGLFDGQKLTIGTKVGRLAKMSDQERWLNEILDILGLPRDTAYRDFTRELVERGAALEQIYGTLRSRMNSRLS